MRYRKDKMEIKLSIEEAYIILMNLQARKQWLEDNKNDSSEIENEEGHIANIINQLRTSEVQKR